LILDYARRRYKVVQEYFLQPFRRKVRKISSYSALSPFSLCKVLLMKICQTSYEDYFRFLDQTVDYRDQMLAYLNEKLSEEPTRWFTPDPEDDPFYHPTNMEEAVRLNKYLAKHKNDPARFLKLDDLPMFRYRWKGNLDILKDVLSQTSLLIVTIGFVLWLGFWRMRRYEVR